MKIYECTHPQLATAFSLHTILASTVKEWKNIYTNLRWFQVTNAMLEMIKYLFPVSVFYISFHNRAHFSHVYPCFDPVDLNVTLFLIGYPVYQDNPEYNRVLFGVLFCLSIVFLQFSLNELLILCFTSLAPVYLKKGHLM